MPLTAKDPNYYQVMRLGEFGISEHGISWVVAVYEIPVRFPVNGNNGVSWETHSSERALSSTEQMAKSAPSLKIRKNEFRNFLAQDQCMTNQGIL